MARQLTQDFLAARESALNAYAVKVGDPAFYPVVEHWDDEGWKLIVYMDDLRGDCGPNTKVATISIPDSLKAAQATILRELAGK